jgi:two-component system, NtrC family, response regulator GlrR
VKSLHGESAAHKELLAKLSRMARTDVEVLITGPTGVGKELYAQYVHEQSGRAKAAFVPLNCGAVVDTLFENELFGHVGGAFTGALTQSQGLVESAEGGTLFLDEVNSLSLSAQIKLLRFMQEKEFRRLGETRLRRADLRVVAATNTDLESAVSAGTFRQDLFFRLRVAPVYVPPLRERPDDLLALIGFFVHLYSEAYRMTPVEFSSAAMLRMEGYSWPGNIRELENCIRYLTCLGLSRRVEPGDLPLLDRGSAPSNGHPPAEDRAGKPFNEAKRMVVDDFEREYLKRALSRWGGNISRAARDSGKLRRAFFELMRKHGLNAGDYRSGTHG